MGVPRGQRGRLDARPAGGLHRARTVRLLLALPGPARATVRRARSRAVPARAGSVCGRPPRRRIPGSRGPRRARCASQQPAPDAVQPAGAPSHAGADQLAGRIERRRSRVGADGTVALPSAVTARSFRVTVLRAAFPATATASAAPGPGGGHRLGVRCGHQAGRDSRERSAARAVRDGRGVGRRPPGAAGAAGQRRRTRRRQAAPRRGRAAPPPPACRWAPACSASPPFRARSASTCCGLSSPAPSPVASPVSGGRVVDPGHIGQSSVTGVRVALNGPSWLVLGESFDNGWRASCDGRSLGAPRVLDGYGNGWLAPAGCKRVSFEFAPQSGVNKSYVISAVAAALILLFLLVGAMRRPTAGGGGGASASARRARTPQAARPSGGAGAAGGDRARIRVLDSRRHRTAAGADVRAVAGMGAARRWRSSPPRCSESRSRSPT